MDETIHDAERLKELQALPLDRKIRITQTRILEWYNHYNGQVYVSFSGGKDSTVLLNLARAVEPDIPAVFSNTGLEYGQIQRFARSFDNVEFLKPKMRFDEVISKYGYPIISKEVAEAIYYARRIRNGGGTTRQQFESAENSDAGNNQAKSRPLTRRGGDAKRAKLRGVFRQERGRGYSDTSTEPG